MEGRKEGRDVDPDLMKWCLLPFWVFRRLSVVLTLRLHDAAVVH